MARDFDVAIAELLKEAPFFAQMSGWVMTEADVASIIRSVLRFIAQCHGKGIIYRDVKPDNFLFLTEQANTVKATDFGLSIRCAMPCAPPRAPKGHSWGLTCRSSCPIPRDLYTRLRNAKVFII